MTDEQIDAVILEELRKYGDPGAKRALTYDSGPYEITKVTQLGRAIGRAIIAASASAQPVAWVQHGKGYPPRLFFINDIDPRECAWTQDVTYELLYTTPPQSTADTVRVPCGCELGTCQSKPGCRMRKEIKNGGYQ